MAETKKKTVKKEKVRQTAKAKKVKQVIKKTEIKKAEKKTKRKKTDEEKKLEKLRKLIKSKKHPKFRGRFGQRQIRRLNNEKWTKWRKPRGVDVRHTKQAGAVVKIGYRTSNEIRHLHPSGLREIYVRNLDELKKAPQGVAIRIQGRLGKKSRVEMKTEAEKLGLRILNL